MISIVIPVYNSEACLPELCIRIQEQVLFPYELILVDDHSQDRSWQVITSLTSRFPELTGIHLRKNSGQDNAIMAGLANARGEYVVIMDDDLQHSPADIPRLIEACQQGYDVCFGRYREFHQSWWKKAGSSFNGLFARIFLGKPHDIYLSPFKVIHRDLVREILSYKGPYPYVDGLILAFTSSMVQIDISHSPRYAGTSTYSLLKSIGVWSKHVTGFSVGPLRLATYGGIASFFVSILMSLFYLYRYFYSDQHLEGWITLVCLILCIGGLNLMFLGIIGEYVGRSYLFLNSKPQYSIKTKVRSVSPGSEAPPPD